MSSQQQPPLTGGLILTDELLLSAWQAMEHLGFLIDAAKLSRDWERLARLQRAEEALSCALAGVVRAVHPRTAQQIKAFRERRLTLVHSLSGPDGEKR